MNKYNNKRQPEEVLDNDVLEMLIAAEEPTLLSSKATARMRNNLMQRVQREKAAELSGFLTVRGNQEEGWIEALPGAKVKILQGDITVPNSLLSYLVQLDPGFSMEGHHHPFDEETLMLEGDLQLGDLHLSAGDFHFAPAGVLHGNVHTNQGCLAYMRGALPV